MMHRIVFKVFTALALICITLQGANAQTASTSASAPIASLTLVAPAQAGSGYDELARSMARVLMKTNLVTQVQVVDLPNQPGISGLQQTLKKYSGAERMLLVGGKSLAKSPESSSLLKTMVPIARITGEFEVLVLPGGSDVESIDSVVTALDIKPKRLPRVSFDSLKEQGMDPAMANWRGVFAVPGSTREQTALLNDLVGRLVRKSEWQQELEHIHSTDFYLSQSDFAHFLAFSRTTVEHGEATAIAPGHTFAWAWSVQFWLLRNRLWVIAALLVGVLMASRYFFRLRTHSRRKEHLLNEQLVLARENLARSTEEYSGLLHGVSTQIDSQMARWRLTDAEQEVALLVLKGLRYKEIANLRNSSERTVRQQAASVYSKAGISGRTDLAAYFLEDLLEPLVLSNMSG